MMNETMLPNGPNQIMTMKEAREYLGYAPDSNLDQLFGYCQVNVIRLPVAPGRKRGRRLVRLLRAEIEAIPPELHNQGSGIMSHGKYPIRVDENGNPGE